MKNDKARIDFLIVGAGASGVYASYLLQKSFLSKDVMMLEKSRGVGGRLATRRFSFDAQRRVAIDLGAVAVQQPFRSTLLTNQNGGHLNFESSSELQAAITSWEDLDVLAGLSNRFLKSLRDEVPNVALHCQHQVTGISYDQQASGWLVHCSNSESSHTFMTSQVILAIPAPQVSALLQQSKNIGHFPVKKIADVVMACRWIWVIAVKKSISLQAVYKPVGKCGIETVFVISQKPGVEPLEGIDLIHVSMTLQWSLGFIDKDKKEVAEHCTDTVIAALSDIIGADLRDQCIEVHCHKWRYAHAINPLSDGFLVNDRQDLWCIGDWLAGYGVDDSFYSAEQMVSACVNTVEAH